MHTQILHRFKRRSRMAGFCRKASQSTRFSDRPDRVTCTQSRMAASGKRNFNGGFPAMNSKRWLSCPDPFRPIGFKYVLWLVTE